METWDYAKTIILYMEHVAMVFAGFVIALAVRNKKYSALKVDNNRKDMLIETYRRDIASLKEQETTNEKEQEVQTETPKALLNIAHLFATEYIKKQFPPGGVIR